MVTKQKSEYIEKDYRLMKNT